VLKIKKILLVGSGNVATHLGINLKRTNYIIKQVFSRSIENAKDLAKKVDSDNTNKPENIVATDLTIIAISDDSIKDVLDFLPDVPTVHTSGSTNINILKNYEQITSILATLISIPLIFLISLFILKKIRKIISSDIDKKILGLLVDKIM
jgi:predicted short-subunit dehydrogenase-like oxidoreductase (DUF2520 family)